MDHHRIFNIIVNDSSSSFDNEVEIIIQCSIEEDRLNNGGGLIPHRHCTFIKRDFLQANGRIFLDYFLNHNYFSEFISKKVLNESFSFYMY
jgi:hypothetical protein